MQRFEDFAAAHGVLIKTLRDNARINSCGTADHPRSKNGRYWWDGQRGWVCAWDADAITHWFESPGNPWTHTDRLLCIKRQYLSRQTLERGWQAAADKAMTMLATATVKEHGHLAYKGLKEAKGLVMPDDTLIVPMRALDGTLRGAQTIRWLPEERRWEKRFLPGMRAKGSVFRLCRGPLTILCEGYTTGLSIELALHQMHIPACVLVCFSASNLEYVAPYVKGRKAVFADNDPSGVGERAAKTTGLEYCMSEQVGEDANDLYVRAGMMALCEIVRTVL